MNERARRSTASSPSPNAHSWNQAKIIKPRIGLPAAKYTGDKWGGKYLRAPDIYWTILKKGRDKLVRLGDVAEVRDGDF